MALIDQESLRSFWKSAPDGRLCPWEVAKALGLREASKEIHDGKWNLPWIAERLTKVGGGSPSKQALEQLFERIDNDTDWFPGKHTGAKRGPKRVFTQVMRNCVAKSMMSKKAKLDEDPTVESAIISCPKATMNPITKQPFCDKTIRDVFTTECYDFDPDFPWVFQHPLQKTFLPEQLKDHRCTMGRYIIRYGQAPPWWPQHVVWFDPCASIIPGSARQYNQMRQALKGNKRYISNDAKLYSPNMPGPRTALKQRQWEGRKVNWFMVLARGVVHIEVMPETWSLIGKGLAEFVSRLAKVLRKMLGPSAPLPRQIFTDRGTGMYNPVGKVVKAYEAAVQKAGFNLYWGPDAHRQSPDMGDLLLHETAVAWFRQLMRKEKPEVVPWEETLEQWARRAHKVTARINKEYDVAGLCREFPQRLQEMVDTGGERLQK